MSLVTFLDGAIDALVELDSRAAIAQDNLSDLNEESWSAWVASHALTGTGEYKAHIAYVDRKYPISKAQYDLYLAFESGEKVFVETKGIFPTYWRKNIKKLDSLLYGRLLSIDNDDASKCSVARALEKLRTESPSYATHIALLLVGSAKPEDRLSDSLDRFASLAHLDESPWQMRSRTWKNMHCPGYEYDIRFWLCEYGECDNWWKKIEHHFAAAH